jgi:hypothetical protein
MYMQYFSHAALNNTLSLPSNTANIAVLDGKESVLLDSLAQQDGKHKVYAALTFKKQT